MYFICSLEYAAFCVKYNILHMWPGDWINTKYTTQGNGDVCVSLNVPTTYRVVEDQW